jgi:hypothetical protein
LLLGLPQGCFKHGASYYNLGVLQKSKRADFLLPQVRPNHLHIPNAPELNEQRPKHIPKTGRNTLVRNVKLCSKYMVK